MCIRDSYYTYAFPTDYYKEVIPFLPYDSINPIYLFFEDYGFEKVSLGFNFNYLGDIYDSVYVGANGLITFDSGYAFGYWDFTLFTGKSIAVCEADLYQLAGGNLYYETIGEAPNRKFIVSYNEIPFWFPSTHSVNAQCILYENSQKIEFQNIAIEIPEDGFTPVLQGLCNSDLSLTYYTNDAELPWVESTFETAFLYSPISCDSTVEQTVVLMEPINTNLTDDTIVCNLDGIELSIDPTELSINWSTGDTTLSTYIVESGVYYLSLIHISEPTRPY